MMNYDSRLAELETRVAFQEDAIDKLSDVIAKQDRTIHDLKKLLSLMNEQQSNQPLQVLWIQEFLRHPSRYSTFSYWYFCSPTGNRTPLSSVKGTCPDR